MCTVTLIARRNGYALGMNRDEKRSRVVALPPARHKVGHREALFPSEPGGGTWIGVNDTGATFALLNWYAMPGHVSGPAVSRGAVVRSALAYDSPSTVGQALERLPLSRLNSFRLIAIFPTQRAVMEWRWNLRRLDSLAHPWRIHTWASSGYDEPGAQQTRGRTFREAIRQSSCGSLAWLRRLHRSHRPERGPYSHCMHRTDAVTVSYTEVACSPHRIILRHTPGAPCGTAPLPMLWLEPDEDGRPSPACRTAGLPTSQACQRQAGWTLERSAD